jgi:tetratricopeptide (TPR) repeat protein
MMGRATLARVRGEKEQALKLAHEALGLEEQNYEIHEFIGDVLMEISRGADALTSYKRARELNPKRVELEDKVARAAVRFAERQDRMAHMSAVLEGKAPKEEHRKPVVAGLLSLVLPGLGQMYCWQMAKGAALAVAYMVLMGLAFYGTAAHVRGNVSPAGADYGAILSGAVGWIVPLAILWVYAIVDAALTAKKSRSSDLDQMI